CIIKCDDNVTKSTKWTKNIKLAGNRNFSGEPPRSTAYYYADLEKIKRQNGQVETGRHDRQSDRQAGRKDRPDDRQADTEQHPNELSEYVETNEIFNDGAVKEIPPLRDRWNVPERKLEETYSTAGTFPMPEPKEKEPLLAELEVVGRVPLTQLDSTTGVRRSRSWYLCCPNMGEEDISRESSWRYSSLRPVTAPPIPGQNGIHLATQSSGRDDIVSLRAERDALARALASERQRAATAARAHDARLAELHGVIAELVRRRAADKKAKAIPEEEVSDECESTTQPAGELDNDGDLSRTEQNENSSIVSPAELPTPQEPKDLPEDTTDTSTYEIRIQPTLEVSPPQDSENCSSLRLSERDSEICVSTARCCQYTRAAHGSTNSCQRERGSPALLPPSPGRCESRQAKIASRVKLKKTEDAETNHLSNEEWCVEAAERLALDVCAQADLREALVAANHEEESITAELWKARCIRLAAECRVLDAALHRAVDTQHRLSCACAMHESSSVVLCSALRAADRALETYDVLLALAETQHEPTSAERQAAEDVATRLLRRLESGPTWGQPLLSPGPWHDHHQSNPSEGPGAPWGPEAEARLRSHAASLKRDTVALRALRPAPTMYSPHDLDESEDCKSVDGVTDMETAVMMQEVLLARENRVVERAASILHKQTSHKNETSRSKRRSERKHWLDTQASETDL
ncbi:uncharacterized protein LOC123704651, partial [Colias croceus]|uniref:uncharacterized protein LOC123704651 n=1 Tax=Colias crocea TaxID=72248 RepID=UPI001E27D897